MRVLWFAPVGLPEILSDMGEKKSAQTGGWMQGLSKRLIEDPNINFCYCFRSSRTEIHELNGYEYFSIENSKDGHDFSSTAKAAIKRKLKSFNPDIILVFGTEHSFQTNAIEIVCEMNLQNRLAVWVQGLVSEYSKHYLATIPEKVARRRSFKELFLRNNIDDMRNDMVRRGQREIRALKQVGHVFVRTDWDRASLMAINDTAIVHNCNESLRSEFYSCEKWNVKTAEDYRIFVSQANYPLKGLQILLSALRIVKRKFPNVHVYTTGKNYLGKKSLLDYMRLSSYQKYILNIIKENNLQENLSILGTLDASQMIEQYQKARVFVSCSSIENSPNSLGEAMLVGTPCIASDVGGVKSMMVDGSEGYLYPYDDANMLAYYICKLFDDSDRQQMFSASAIKKAEQTHDSMQNYETMIKAFKEMSRMSVGQNQE